jgi:CRISPR-associated protein Cas2
MLTVVSYDVRQTRRRTRLAKALKDFGQRVQLSVFECHLDEKQVARMRTVIERFIDPAEDSVRIYRLCKDCDERLETLGVGERTEDPDVYVL